MTVAPYPEDTSLQPAVQWRQPTTELAKYKEMAQVAELLIRARYCNVKDSADALWIVMTGHGLGIDPIASLRGINVIQGKPELSADMMMAVALKHPECKMFRTMEMTDERAVVEVQRRGWPDSVKYDYTFEEAQAAGLTNKQNWRKHRRDMLKARAISRAARAAFPDALMGVYVEGELDDSPQPEPAPRQQPIQVEHDKHESTLDLTKELIQEVHGAVNDTEAADLFLEGLCTKWKVERLEHAPLELLRKTLDAFAATTPEKRSAIIMAAKPQPQGDIEGMGKSARKMSGQEQSLRLATRLKTMVQRCEDEGLITPLQAESFEGFVCDKAGVGLLEEIEAEKLSRWCDRLECADGETCDLKKRSSLILDSIP